jgi:DNA mismatch endonuclease (patch repair protein)
MRESSRHQSERKRAPSKYVPWPDVTEARRRTMSAIRSRDTKPELSVRRLLHGQGYRFVVGRRIVGYRPDVVFTRRRKAVFVHGCFWHGHQACKQDRVPKTRSEYWCGKLVRNKERDRRAREALEASGWEVMTIWECEVRRDPALRLRLIGFLGPPLWRQSASMAGSAGRNRAVVS